MLSVSIVVFIRNNEPYFTSIAKSLDSCLVSFDAKKTSEMLKFQITRRAENLYLGPVGYDFCHHSK